MGTQAVITFILIIFLIALIVLRLTAKITRIAIFLFIVYIAMAYVGPKLSVML